MNKQLKTLVGKIKQRQLRGIQHRPAQFFVRAA